MEAKYRHYGLGDACRNVKIIHGQELNCSGKDGRDWIVQTDVCWKLTVPTHRSANVLKKACGKGKPEEAGDLDEESHKWIRATSVRTSNQDNGPDTYPGSGCGQIPVFTFFNHSRSLLGFALFPASFVPLSRQISQEPIRDATKNGRVNLKEATFTISMLG
ncbi:hypothetical protein TcasGA2_TC003725 [Tribolium castaneum]|uniref:Uncharacterized protein n=1 Tax=Tribolium castaneum TaxID=7070 RepID=D6WDV9_TRICA|nr:hypothetical protein TcasGA2_TC003725 [Tribolium castaneum]